MPFGMTWKPGKVCTYACKIPSQILWPNPPATTSTGNSSPLFHMTRGESAFDNRSFNNLWHAASATPNPHQSPSVPTKDILEGSEKSGTLKRTQLHHFHYLFSYSCLSVREANAEQ